MVTDSRIIRDIYKRKITLFSDLLECVTQERENLINLDIKALWALMLKKQKIMEDILSNTEIPSIKEAVLAQ